MQRDKVMAPGTHALIGWWSANGLSRQDRLLVFLGGVLPDVIGLGGLRPSSNGNRR